MAIGPREQALRDMRARGRFTKPTAPAVRQNLEATMSKTTTAKQAPKPKAKGKKTAARKPAAKAATKAKDPDGKPAGVRPGSKLELVAGLLTRPEGCTGKEILAATGWPTVSVPQQAKAAGLTLKKEKDGGVTRYRAA